MSNIYVALSGGVDSAVAAHILAEQGHTVVGVFIRVWQPDFLPCTQDEEEKAALRVAAALSIPFRRLDLSREYKTDVVDEMVAQYRNGNTPNPDVLCNAHIKFDAFLDYARRNGADAIATGHHARVEARDSSYALMRGRDASKDQSYFLWHLTQQQLAHTYMPVGAMTKHEVRDYAARHRIPSAAKPDSQGLCFLGDVNMREFLAHFITPKKGIVVNEQGVEIGEHDGAAFVTLGQRGGFCITDSTHQGSVYYVVGKDVSNNTVTVAPTPTAPTARATIPLCDTNWIRTAPDAGEAGERFACEIRYHGTPLPCMVHTNGKSYVELAEPVLVAPGQSVVVYRDDECLGGGVVVRA